jgi:hypothetical protein
MPSTASLPSPTGSQSSSSGLPSQPSGGDQGTSSSTSGTIGSTSAGLPGSQPGSNMPGTTASSTSGNGDSSGSGDGGVDVSVQAGGLPGLDPFPGGTGTLPGTGTAGLEDIFGSGQQGAGTGSGNDPLVNGSGQGDDPFGGIGSSSTVAAGTAGGQDGAGDHPFGGVNGGGNQPMTAAERQAVLDGRLNESIAVFDGMILSEREQAQGAANENGAGGAGGGTAGGTGGSGREGDGSGDNPVVIASAPPISSSGAGRMPNMGRSREGDFDNSNQESFPPPADIPNGNDDDVVARQLREAAMNEPDPELRERLWNEYRTYTGLPIPQEAVAEFEAEGIE